MEVAAAVEQTRVTAVPKDWNVKSLGTECKSVTKGTTPTSIGRGFTSSGIGFVKAETIGGSGRMIMAKMAFIDDSTHRVLRRSQLSEGDILVSIAGVLGRIGIVERSILPANTNQALAIIRLRPDSTLSRSYLFYFLQSSMIWRQINDMTVRAAQANISLQNVREFQISIPPTEGEQTVIASTLSDTDALISSLENLIAKKRDVKKGTMQMLLTGRKRLPGFSGEWRTQKMGDLLNYEQPWKYIVRSVEYSKSGMPVLTANKSFILGYTHERDGVCTDTPVIIFDDFTTDSKYVDFPFKVKSSAVKLLRARRDKADVRFMFGKMQTITFHVGNHKRYYLSEYRHLDVRVPDLEEQVAIAEVLSDVDQEVAALERKLEKYRLIKQGMMQELLTGKKRLICEN